MNITRLFEKRGSNMSQGSRRAGGKIRTKGGSQTRRESRDGNRGFAQHYMEKAITKNPSLNNLERLNEWSENVHDE